MIEITEAQYRKNAELIAYLYNKYGEIYYDAAEKVALQSFRPDEESYWLTEEERRALTLIQNKFPRGIR